MTFGVETTDDSIRRFRKRHGIQIPGVEKASTRVRGDNAEATTRVKERTRDMYEAPVLDDPDTMLRDRGLDPEQWYIDNVTVNEWDGPQKDGNVVTYYQAKFTARRHRPEAGLQPVRSDGWRRPRRNCVKKYPGEPELVVICGDQHAPFHDIRLHNLFLDWLMTNRPDRGVILGDLGDYPDLSRHPDDPENVAKAQECAQSSYDVVRGYVDAWSATEWDYLIGNHDARVRSYMIANAPRLYPLHQVDTPEGPGAEIHAMSHVLRLDELGVNLVDPEGSYEYAQVELSEKLAVLHGWIARKGSGVSALQTLQDTGYSVIIGHSHRQSCVYHTKPEIDGALRTTVAVEAGCMCRIDKRNERDLQGRRYPNYGSGHADWQQGFVTATLWPDQSFKIDQAVYVNNALLYRDQRYV